MEHPGHEAAPAGTAGGIFTCYTTAPAVPWDRGQFPTPETVVLPRVRGQEALIPSGPQDGARELSLEIGENRLVVGGPQRLYHLDICVPLRVKAEESRAAFHRKRKVRVWGAGVAEGAGPSRPQGSHPHLPGLPPSLSSN